MPLLGSRKLIEPGHPWENPYVESFHGKLRDECLNREVLQNGARSPGIAEGLKAGG